ncbi:MAG TPA: glycosyltransferase family 2 protein [Nevskiaceae bacterium]|nr:glycosyltransferase family 2 protein [Nevskiaceae bacterium]
MSAVLSVVIPCYNEMATLASLIEAVRRAAVPGGVEIIVVDDGSSDGSRDLLANQLRPLVDQVILHERNRGKGAAVRTGIQAATGDYVIVQDADREYDPAEYPKLLTPVLEGKADAVFGSRFAGGETHRVLYFWHSLANRMLTLLSNMVTNLNLTDMECCYKLFRRELIQSIQLAEEGFGFEPEVTAKLARVPGVRIYEVGISYAGRTYAEGKKINWKDGVWALWCIFRYGLLRA